MPADVAAGGAGILVVGACGPGRRGAAPGSVVAPDAPDFLSPEDMREAIRLYCRRTGQREPQSPGEMARCCLESLALKYRWVIEALEGLTGQSLDTVRIVGGGSQ